MPLSTVAAPVSIPTKQCRVSLFSTPSPVLSHLFIIYILQAGRCEITTVLICSPLMSSVVEHQVLLAICVCLLWEMVCSGPFLNWLFQGFLLLNHMSSLYVLDIHPLSDRWLANIFSWFTGCLFILLSTEGLVWYSPTCWFLLSLPLVSVWGRQKNSLPRLMSRNFSLCFHQGVWQFQITFKYVVYFQLIFLRSEDRVQDHSFSIIQLQNHILKRLSFHQWIFIVPFSNIRIYLGLFLGSQFCPIDMFCLFYISTIVF